MRFTLGRAARDVSLMFGHTPLKTGGLSATWFDVLLFHDPKKQAQTLLRERSGRDTKPVIQEMDFPNSGSFRLRRYQGRISAWIDEKPIFQNVPWIDHRAEENPHIALGATRADDGLVVEFSGLEVRAIIGGAEI